MTNLEFCIARRKAEGPAFLKVLKAMPEGRLDYRPDPKSRTAAELAWVLAAEEEALLALLDTGTIDWKETPPPRRDRTSWPPTRRARGRRRAAGQARCGSVGEARPFHHGRANRLGGHDGPDDVGLPVRRHPPPRAAQHLPAPDGGQGAVDLRPLGRRHRSVDGARALRSPGSWGHRTIPEEGQWGPQESHEPAS